MKILILIATAIVCTLPVHAVANPPDTDAIHVRDTRTANSNAILARRAVEALNSGDQDQFVMTLSPNHLLRRLGEPDMPKRGRGEAWSAVSELRASLSGFNFTPERIIAGRHFAAVVGVVEGRNVMAIDGVPPSNTQLRAHALYLAFMRNGAIRNSLVYFGVDELILQSAGGESTPPVAHEDLQIATVPKRIGTDVLKTLHDMSLLAVRARLAGLSGDEAARKMVRGSFRPTDLAGSTVHRIAELKTAIPDLALRLDDIFAAEDFVVALMTIRGKVTSPVGLLAKIDRNVTAKAAVVMKLAREGRVESVEIFLDQRAVRRQLGLGSR